MRMVQRTGEEIYRFLFCGNLTVLDIFPGKEESIRYIWECIDNHYFNVYN